MNEELELKSISQDTCFVAATNVGKGRRAAVVPGPTAARYLHYGREGDCVLMPQGYHPNVAAPGTQINFLWMMAAIREGEDRLYGIVNVQPEFADGGSGLEAAAGR